MSHQCTFYLDGQDAADLENRIRALEPVLVLHRRSPGPSPFVLPSTNALGEDGRPWLHYCLVRPEDLGQVVTRFVPAQAYWSIDSLRSPVIEYTRCFADGTLIRQGRLSFADGYFGADAAWVEKSSAFQAWARRVLAQARASLERSQDDRIGPGARAFIARGGRLEGS